MERSASGVLIIESFWRGCAGRREGGCPWITDRRCTGEWTYRACYMNIGPGPHVPALGLDRSGARLRPMPASVNMIFRGWIFCGRLPPYWMTKRVADDGLSHNGRCRRDVLGRRSLADA
jgi:hypothetical protein